MTERLLQYIWQFQYYNVAGLQTQDGEQVQIIYPGSYNTNQGPDFLDAKIKIGDTVWAGSIELHVQASQWHNHKHSSDDNYNNVILHVVWQNDKPGVTNLPTAELQPLVSTLLLTQYEALMTTGGFIPCEKILHNVPAITWVAWKERLLVERLLQKSNIIFDYLRQSNNHWEEAFWWLLAKNFGIKINSAAFEQMAQSIPVTVLAKHKNQIHQLEALLLGQAGLLNDNYEEDYPNLLKKEYQFLQTKYKLKPAVLPVHFLRMRPANFPTVRLAQLAMLVYTSVHLFAKVKECITVEELQQLLQVTANDYWHYHYIFDEPVAFKKKTLGTQMIDNIIINTIVPTVFAYGQYHNDNSYKDKALRWLEKITAEKNVITNGFMALGVTNGNAFDSQALIQLKNNYCNKKHCLSCSVGNSLLKAKK
jgi:hypothetical protein